MTNSPDSPLARLRHDCALSRPDPCGDICTVYAADLSLALKALECAREFIDDSPIGDDDKPYCSDVMQTEFKKLAVALSALHKVTE